ncbi:AbrB/MazE/SpoVT family DNA-binding domain-containing protein [Nitrososphaera sp.]|uniref:AbrB/MazE/SpoVT family DNA-binding domain-containing protein n=1 Tax=Nitrososphaera sp. TaxID=1971748 RepID=UPI0017FCD7FA|nr:AbrB/MazE/SpoVT family DNA-binding domain-containing protein [Nitrososphaera sp.]NWG37262.1 AbrB/MazE/SpoVT family DNA-binding domain-containing protein [Nitrososphaera sp.]
MSSSNNPADPVDAFKKAVEKGSEAQKELAKQVSSIQMDAMQNYFAMLRGLSFYNAMFKTTVQSGSRISIPEAERQALDIEDGDLVQVIVIPIERKRKKEG